MTLADLTPEMIKQFEAERKAKQEKNNRINQLLAQQKAENDAYWMQKRNSKLHTAQRVEHQCEVCNGTISIGEQYRSRTITVNVSRQGWTPKQRTVYRHLKCSSKMEA